MCESRRRWLSVTRSSVDSRRAARRHRDCPCNQKNFVASSTDALELNCYRVEKTFGSLGADEQDLRWIALPTLEGKTKVTLTLTFNLIFDLKINFKNNFNFTLIDVLQLILQELHQLLMPFMHFTKYMEADSYVTLSSVVPAILNLLLHVQQTVNYLTIMKSAQILAKIFTFNTKFWQSSKFKVTGDVKFSSWWNANAFVRRDLPAIRQHPQLGEHVSEVRPRIETW
jgi:hypothetical protein